MNRRILWLYGVMLALATVVPAVARAQGTGLVPSSDPVYADIDRLSDLGVLRDVVLGQRPYSRREIGRIARLARERLNFGSMSMMKRLTEDELAQAEEILQHLDARFVDTTDALAPLEPYVAWVDNAALSFVATDIVRRGFPAPHTQPLNATIDPLTVQRLGRPLAKGRTGTLEAAQRIELGAWLALQATERVDAYKRDDSTDTKVQGELLLGSARARVKNVALTVGRQQVMWGQHDDLGLFLAAYAPALDAITLASDHPFELPGFLKPIGPAAATLVYAELGPSPTRSHSKLLAYKVSVVPNPAVEIGGTIMNHFGGEGGRTSTLGNRLVDFLPFIDVFRTHNYVDTTSTFDVDSDKLLGMDARLRLDRLAGITLLGEFLIDDFDVHRLRQFFTEEGSQSLAIIVPAIGGPSLSARLTAKHMGPITYTHAALTSGMTTRGRLLGDELGPDAKSFGARLQYMPSGDMWMSLEGRSIQYSNATYTAFYTDAAQKNFEVRKVAAGPNELRDVFTGNFFVNMTSAIALTMRGGAEHIRNADFMGGHRWDYQFQIALQLLQ